ncbi:MAG: hypothetical protein AAB421_02745 [Patescibacteria group bacterium]
MAGFPPTVTPWDARRADKDARMSIETVYIALDVETTGSRLGVDSMLSIGACVVPREPKSYEDMVREGFVFYEELKPTSFEYIPAAIRVGASELDALKSCSHIPRMFPKNPFFEPREAIRYLQDVCTYPPTAMRRFAKWIEDMGRFKRIEPVVDTVFFDSGWINLAFGVHLGVESPFGYSGLDLDSLWRGATGKEKARLKEIGLVDDRKRPHKADEDAAFLAKIAQRVLYEKYQW